MTPPGMSEEEETKVEAGPLRRALASATFRLWLLIAVVTALAGIVLTTWLPGSPPTYGITAPWWLLAGGLVATVAEGFARMNLLGQLVTWHVNWGQWPASWSVSWPVVWFGLGLVIFARVMRIGAGMRADLEGTV